MPSDRALGVTIPQPWAGMLVLGEMRSINLQEPTDYTGVILVRSANVPDVEVLNDDSFMDKIERPHLCGWHGQLLGTVIARRMVDSAGIYRMKCPYASGPWVLSVNAPMALADPKPSFGPSAETWPAAPELIDSLQTQLMDPESWIQRFDRRRNTIPNPGPPRTRSR